MGLEERVDSRASSSSLPLVQHEVDLRLDENPGDEARDAGGGEDGGWRGLHQRPVLHGPDRQLVLSG